MQRPSSYPLADELAAFDPADPQYATRVVDRILQAARESDASDLHLQPGGDGLQLKFRIDGVLLPVARFPIAVAPNIVARLKVLAELLTYQTDRPQEGRIRTPGTDVEMRVSTFPTLHGERAVVRLFGASERFERLDDLGVHVDVQKARRLLEHGNGRPQELPGPAHPQLPGQTGGGESELQDGVHRFPPQGAPHGNQ